MQAHGPLQHNANGRAEFERAPDLTRRRLYLETMERVLDRAEVVVLEDGTRLNWIERDR